jgi:hypothetical protein
MSGAEELYRRVPPWAQTALLNLYALRVRQHRYGRRYRERVAELLAGLRERLGETMKIELELTEDIPCEASGKFRWVVSRVDHPNLVDWESSVERG